MADEGGLLGEIGGKLLIGEDELLTELFEGLGEDFAVPQDPVQAGLRVFHSYIAGIRAKLCASETRAFLKQDFERSGPALAALLAGDAYLTSLGLPAQATVGALIVKLGVDRICSG